MALSRTGDRPGANAAYRQAIDLDPHYAPAHTNMALLLLGEGNLTGAEAAVHRALVLGVGERLRVADFAWIVQLVEGGRGPAGGPPLPVFPGGPAADVPLEAGGYEAALARCDRELLARALAQCGGKIRETARLLGIARNTLKAKMRRYGLE